jgi:hypothetical protein
MYEYWVDQCSSCKSWGTIEDIFYTKGPQSVLPELKQRPLPKLPASASLKRKKSRLSALIMYFGEIPTKKPRFFKNLGFFVGLAQLLIDVFKIFQRIHVCERFSFRIKCSNVLWQHVTYMYLVKEA